MGRRGRRLGVAVLSGAAAVAGTASVLVVRRSRRDRDRGAPAAGAVSHAGRGARTAQVARMGGRTGGAYALHRARRVFASADARRQLDRSFEVRTAEQVAEALGDMKGALMKVGQMLSYLDESLPEPLRAALATLQADAPAMSPELAAAVVAEELGAPPELAFAEWDPRPIAAASIGQVHRAITRDGRAVAVKVQYPGVDQAIRSDLANSDLLFAAMGMLFPGLDPGPIVEEIRERLEEELDYRTEAANQQLFADYYRGHPFIHVPDVLPDLSTGRVLTTELAEGARFAELDSWSQAERDLAAEAIYRFVFRSLYRFHVFNGDPHPGNYLFRPDGRVTFLDFGLVKRFTSDEVALFERMAITLVLEGDVSAFRAVIEEAGVLRPGAPLGEEEVRTYFGHFYEAVLTSGPSTFTPEYAAETVERLLGARDGWGAIARHGNVPASFVILQRINLGLFAILGRLRATANWRAIAEELWPFVDGPPSTALGRAEAEWVARQ